METEQPALENTSSEASIITQRLKKIADIKAEGGEPWPYGASPSASIEDVVEKHGEQLEAGESTEDRYTLAGRLMGRRGQGKLIFGNLSDRSGNIQLFISKAVIGDEHFAIVTDQLDIGDWIEVSGLAMKSRRGELSLKVDKVTMLAKCIRPLPEKYHGLVDEEQRRAKRYLDLVANRESFDVFRNRSKIISAIRRELDSHDYMEVETPILQPIYGGAAARPFTTHHNALDQNFFLRIAVELYLKRLIVGGFERVYEIGRNFRNEGISFKHNPEFTMIELYEAFGDYELMMERCEQVVRAAVKSINSDGSEVIHHPEHGEINFAGPWKRMPLAEAIKDECGLDIYADSDEDIRAKLESDGYNSAGDKTRGKLIDALLSKYVEPKLIQPTFLTEYPVSLSPFARSVRDGREGIVERFECFVVGMELANAFSEINNPQEQRERFDEQQKAREAGDDEAEMLDEDFLMALEYGMPPTGGLGIGIDRLVMILTGQSSIRDVVLFPARRR